MCLKPAEWTKVEAHEKLNMAYAILISLALELNLKAFYDDLQKDRTFLSQEVDRGIKKIV